MSYRDKQIARASFHEVPETCPHVDDALEVAAESIKKQTSALRESLNLYISKYLEEEEKVSDLERLVSELQSEIESLKREIAEQ